MRLDDAREVIIVQRVVVHHIGLEQDLGAGQAYGSSAEDVRVAPVKYGYVTTFKILRKTYGNFDEHGSDGKVQALSSVHLDNILVLVMDISP